MNIKYNTIKGFNYVPSYARNDIEFWRDYDCNVINNEMALAKKLGLNSSRIFLSYVVYENNPQEFIANVKHFVKVAYDNQITTMLVLFDACFSMEQPRIDWNKNEWIPNPGCMNLEEHFWKKGEAYCDALIEAFNHDPAMIIWDIMNEPTCTSFISSASAEHVQERLALTYNFINHFVDYLIMRGVNAPLTVGIPEPQNFYELESFSIIQKLGVLSFHNYSHNIKIINSNYNKAINFSKIYKKPIIISELGCPIRGNPYDISLEIANEFQMGYYIWELMIGKSFWNDKHGIVYPDGTVRDTALVAALFGFFRNRSASAVRINLNSEGRAKHYIGLAENILSDENFDFDKAADVLETIAYLIESSEIVPLNILPSTRFRAIIGSRDVEKLKKQMQEWLIALKKECE